MVLLREPWRVARQNGKTWRPPNLTYPAVQGGFSGNAEGSAIAPFVCTIF